MHNTCPRCLGKKVMSVAIEDYFSSSAPSTITIDCVFCNSTGTMSTQQISDEKNFWCGCGNPSGTSEYIPDFATEKHHYRCNDCNKVTQVG